MSDSDSDDVPLSRKVAVAKKPAPAPAKAAAKAVAVKKEVVTPPKAKKEPHSNGAAKVKKEAKVKAEKAEDAAQKKIREKKEFDMPGQTRETPPDTDALRKFYTSLLQQRQGSSMARKWCVMHGLLPREEALDWLSQLGKIKSPTKENGKAGVKRAAEPSRAKPPAKKVKTEAPKPKPKPVAKKPAAKKKAPLSSEDEASDSADSDDDMPLARRVK